MGILHAKVSFDKRLTETRREEETDLFGKIKKKKRIKTSKMRAVAGWHNAEKVFVKSKWRTRI